MILPVLQLVDMGFIIYATSGTSKVLGRYGIPTSQWRSCPRGERPTSWT